CHLFGSIPTALKTLECTNPAPITSIQPVFLHNGQPAPAHLKQEISTSNPGSTNAKKLGRNRSFVLSPYSFLNKNSSVPLRCATDTSLSTKRPSIWKNCASWVASVASFRKTLPGAIIRSGKLFLCFSI